MLITACEDKYNKLWTSSMALWFVFLIKVNVTYTKNCWLASGFSSLGKDNHGLWKWTRSLACLRKPGCLNRVGVWLKKQEGSGGSQMEAGTPGGERCGREAPLRTPAWSALLNGSKHRAPKLQSATAPGVGSVREVLRKGHTQMSDTQPMERAGVNFLLWNYCFPDENVLKNFHFWVKSVQMRKLHYKVFFNNLFLLKPSTYFKAIF